MKPEIMPMEWDNCDPEFEFCKGHVDKQEFREALGSLLGVEPTQKCFPDNSIRHEYARNLQTARSRLHGWACELRIVPKGRGAYPITVYYYDTPDPAKEPREQ